VLFSSSPGDFDEATHINTHPTATWAQWFAERGLFRRIDVDLTFLSPWAVLFERADADARTLVHRYESLLTPLTDEVLEKRAALVESHRNVSALHDRLTALEGSPEGELAATKQHVANLEAQLESFREEVSRARHDRLTMRDHAIGSEAEIARLTVELTTARDRVTGLRKRVGNLQRKLKDERTARRGSHDRLIKVRAKLVEERGRADARDREVRQLKESHTWRIGRFFIAPFSIFKR
jgi:chromosome segregation ATPase